MRLRVETNYPDHLLKVRMGVASTYSRKPWAAAKKIDRGTTREARYIRGIVLVVDGGVAFARPLRSY
jgi:hypothetical protein